jgi:hypothetical protein
MSTKKISIEQRHHTRLPLREGVVLWRNGSCNIGSILDISGQGVSFIYVTDATSQAALTDTLDIYFFGGKFAITGICIGIISDILISSGKPYSNLSKRRRSVKFINLTDQQRRLLRDVTSGLFLNSLAVQDSVS